MKIPLPELDPGAQALVDMDALIQSFTKKVDQLAETAVQGIAGEFGSAAEAPDTSCEAKRTVLPINLAMAALEYGEIKLAFRVLPRLGVKYIEQEFSEKIQKIAGRAAAKKFSGFVPLLGQLVEVLLGVKSERNINREIAAEIRAVLGCKPNILDPSPMRAAFNKLARGVVERVEKETRKTEPVATRKLGTNSSAGGDF